MGMYDSVLAPCTKCDEYVEFQSKAGDCLLSRYFLDAVPVAIANDVEGDTECCEACGTPVTLRFAPATPQVVQMCVE